MRYTIKATLITHTPAIDQYVDKKLGELERVLDKDDESIYAQIEVGQTTKHHRSGEIFFAEINLHALKKQWRVVEEATDLYAAIDAMKDSIVREITSAEKRERTEMRKGARLVKKRLHEE